ncbi:MAG TPA: flagellar assembly protein FliW [Acidimicrobiales bacterium]|nr:flagellar assembly protein FliW [Acidimicrobiales bacterium]
MAIKSDRTTESPLSIEREGEDDLVLTFVAGLPGFPDAHKFVLDGLGAELEPFCRMRSLDQRDLTFTVMPPGLLFPDYAVVIDEESVERLGITTAEDAVVLAIVTLSVPPEPPKVNLLGPIVINRRTRSAAQVVQHGSNHGVAVPLVAAQV